MSDTVIVGGITYTSNQPFTVVKIQQDIVTQCWADAGGGRLVGDESQRLYWRALTQQMREMAARSQQSVRAQSAMNEINDFEIAWRRRGESEGETLDEILR